MALGLFVYQFRLGHSILAAGLTLACLILPIVIVATREALRAIPDTIREASYALGATQWQTVGITSSRTPWVALPRARLLACLAPLAKRRRW